MLPLIPSFDGVDVADGHAVACRQINGWQNRLTNLQNVAFSKFGIGYQRADFASPMQDHIIRVLLGCRPSKVLEIAASKVTVPARMCRLRTFKRQRLDGLEKKPVNQMDLTIDGDEWPTFLFVSRVRPNDALIAKIFGQQSMEKRRWLPSWRTPTEGAAVSPISSIVEAAKAALHIWPVAAKNATLFHSGWPLGYKQGVFVTQFTRHSKSVTGRS